VKIRLAPARLAMIIAAALAATACNKPAEAPAADAAPAEAAAVNAANPFFQPSALQYLAPDFAAIQDEHYAPAFEEGMKQHSAEIRAIADSAEAPTFENTIVAMEKSGAVLQRVATVFFGLASAHTNEAIQAVQVEMAPKLAAHEDSIYLDAPLFARVKAVYDARDTLGLDAESARLLERSYKAFVRAGAQLDDAGKARLREINARESSLTTEFSNKLLAATNANAVVVDSADALKGFSEGDIAAAAEAAKARELDGQWVITLQNTTRQPALVSLEDRALRERVWRASAERGAQAGNDTRPLVLEMAKLRAEKAALLGFANWAAYVLDDQMAKTPEAAYKILTDLVPQVVANAKAEEAEIAKVMAADGVDGPVQPWDWEFYAEKVRAERYALDAAEVAPYFELDRVFNDAMGYSMNQLFGVTFKPRPDLPVYHPDVKAYEVFEADGRSIGLFYADYFARPSKRGGAWMGSYVPQSTLLGQKPVVVNVMNITKGADGQPTLLSFSEVTTLLHEVGHALHGLFANTKYPSLSGTAVSRDYVEFPSQFLEDIALDPAVLANYAKHHETGEPIPAELMQKVLDAGDFNQGFDSAEYIASALIDLDWHTLAADQIPTDVAAFEQASLARHGLALNAIPPRYKSPYFAHTFAGGYSAGYYAYLWAEVLAADAYQVMQQRGGLTRENGDAVRREVFSVGNTREPMESYRAFAGRDPEVDALLKRRGLQ
jgi:peptidyl-dipeptidase Dcp